MSAIFTAVSQMPECSGLRLELLSAFALRSQGAPWTVPVSAQKLLAFLALQGRPTQRAIVASRLWVHGSEPRALASLRSVLWRLGVSFPSLVTVSGSLLQLSEAITVDVHGVEAQARRLIGQTIEPSTPADLLFSSSDLRADLLPDWADEWVLVERERLRQLRLHALESMAERLTRLRRHALAVDAAMAAVALDPLRESAHRVLIAAHLAEGNRAEALRQFRAYRTVIRRDVGLGPSPDIVALVRDLL